MAEHRMITLELEGITKVFGPTFALDNVSMAAEAGRVHAIVGENGAGKSTLLKIIAGAVAPTSGEMRLRGERVSFDRISPNRSQRLGVSVVHQEFSLLPALTVAENVFLGREPRRHRMVDRRRMVRDTGDLLVRLGSMISPLAPVESLSIAGAQIVEVAKALSFDADVLAMDEPSAVLSGPELEQLFSVVRALRREGVAVLYVSHRLDEVFDLCDRYTVLKDGRVSGTGDIADVTRDELVTMMVGREISQIFPASNAQPGVPRLQVRDLAIEGLPTPVSFEVHSREVVGLVGLAGAGRTRLARGLFGAVPATGEILVDGVRHRAFRRPARAIIAGLAYLPEDRKADGLALAKSVRWNMSLNVIERLSGWLLASTPEKEFAAKALDDFDIRTNSDGRPVGSLSGGNQQKAMLAKWLALTPKVVLLDEPTRGVDVGSKEQIYVLLRRLADEGAAVLLISSELVEVLGLSDRVLVMADGRIAGEFSHEDATEERVLKLITSATRHETVKVGD